MKIEIINRARKKHLDKKVVFKSVSRIFGQLEAAGVWKRKRYEVAVVLVAAAESRALNRRFLGKNRPASVLSFDYGEQGEILLSPDAVSREAAKSNRTFAGELTRLVTHAALHLAGIHHELPGASREKFEKLEKTLLERIGVGRAVRS